MVISNTGDVALSGVKLADSELGNNLAGVTCDVADVTSATGATLAAGATATCFYSLAWAAGEQLNTASATASYTDDFGNELSPEPTGSDPAYHFGADPSIDVDVKTSACST